MLEYNRIDNGSGKNDNSNRMFAPKIYGVHLYCADI